MNDKHTQMAALVTDVLKFYGQDVTRFTLQVWLNAMQPFEIETVSRAFSKHVSNPERGQFPPKPADIVKALQGTMTDRAALAWGKVLDSMSSVGAYSDIVFDDAAIHAAINDMGGWPKVCRTDTSELGFLQHRFTQAHKAYTERGQFDYPRRLSGDRSPDQDYERRGLPLPKPALIGNPDTARAVYRAGTVGKTAITFASIGNLAGALTHEQ